MCLCYMVSGEKYDKGLGRVVLEGKLKVRKTYKIRDTVKDCMCEYAEG